MRKFLSLFLSVVMTLGFVGCVNGGATTSTPPQVEEKKYIYFEQSVIELYENESQTFSLQRNGVEDAASFSTSNNAVAVVEDGKIVAKGVGECILTAKAGDYTTNCKVIVSRDETFRFVSFDVSEKNLIVGETYALGYTTKNAELGEVEISSSAPNVVSVDNKGDGTVAIKAVGEGRAEILGKIGNVTAKCSVSVYTSTVSRLSLPQITVNGREVSFQKKGEMDGICYRVGTSAWIRTTEPFIVENVLPVADSLKVECKAFSDDMSYLESEIVTVEIYGELYVYGDAGKVLWNARTGASNYDVYVDGALVSENQTECYYNVADDDMYEVQVIADTEEASNVCMYFPNAYSVKKLADMRKAPSFSAAKNNAAKYDMHDGRSVLRISAALNWGPNRYFGLFVGNDGVMAGDKIYFKSKLGEATLKVKTGEETVTENGVEKVKEITSDQPIGHLSDYVSTCSADMYSRGYGTSREEEVELIDGWTKNTVTLTENDLFDSDADGRYDTVLVGYWSSITKMTDKTGNALNGEKLLQLLKENGYDVGLTTATHLNEKGWITYPIYIADIYFEHFSPAITVEKAIDELVQNVDVDELAMEDFESLCGIKNQYEALSASDKLAVENYSTFETYYNRFNEKFEVKVLFDGTETGLDGGIVSSSKVTTTYGVDNTYGSYVQVTGNQDTTTGVYFNKGEEDYSGYTLYMSLQTRRDRTVYYSTTTKDGHTPDRINNGTYKTLTDTTANVWTTAALTLEGDWTYLTIDFNANKDYWLKIGPIYAIYERLTPAIIVEKAIDELVQNVDVDELAMEDFESLCSIKNQYEALSASDKLAVENYSTFESYYNRFYEKFEVKVLFDGTETGLDGGIVSSSKVTTTYGVDNTYGSYVQVTGNQDTTTGVYFNKGEEDYSGYTLYMSLQTRRDRTVYYSTTTKDGHTPDRINNGTYKTLTDTTANVWTTAALTLEGDWTYLTIDFNANKDYWLKIGPIYAIKEK